MIRGIKNFFKGILHWEPRNIYFASMQLESLIESIEVIAKNRSIFEKSDMPKEKLEELSEKIKLFNDNVKKINNIAYINQHRINRIYGIKRTHTDNVPTKLKTLSVRKKERKKNVSGENS